MTRKITQAGLLTALALLLSYIESLLPFSFGFPGIKLGLANLVTVTAFYFLDVREVFVITLIRIFFTGFFAANAMALALSLAGGIASFCVMYLCLRLQSFSPVGISIAGGATHNLAQLAGGMLLLSTTKLLTLLPVLLLAGCLTGLCIGVLASGIIKALPNRNANF